jgi:hypothetical protein
MDTRQKGERACLEVQLRAVEKGMVVSRPSTEARYDLILDDGGHLQRAQVKYGDGSVHDSQGAVSVQLRTSVGNKYKYKTYAANEVDVLLVYLPKLDAVVALPPDKFIGKQTLCLRLEPSKNNQKYGVLMAADFIW